MSFQASFKQILKNKLNQEQSFEVEAPAFAQSEKSLDPSHLAYLIGNIGRLSTLHRGGYPPPKIRPARKPHNLSDLQRHSYEFLKKWVHDFSDAFTESELKKAFRQAAIVLHPDQGGNTVLFIELKGHLESLRVVFNKPPQKDQAEQLHNN
jgi:hypothetical protein